MAVEKVTITRDELGELTYRKDRDIQSVILNRSDRVIQTQTGQAALATAKLISTDQLSRGDIVRNGSTVYRVLQIYSSPAGIFRYDLEEILDEMTDEAAR